jgi:hypothetical protein
MVRIAAQLEPDSNGTRDMARDRETLWTELRDWRHDLHADPEFGAAVVRQRLTAA